MLLGRDLELPTRSGQIGEAIIVLILGLSPDALYCIVSESYDIASLSVSCHTGPAENVGRVTVLVLLPSLTAA